MNIVVAKRMAVKAWRKIEAPLRKGDDGSARLVLLEYFRNASSE
jgi:hypothetical protein